MQVDLLNQDYPDKSIDQNQSRLINLYLQSDKSKGKYQLVAYPMPGLTTFCNTGQANIRAMHELNGTVYVVAGNKFGSINSSGVFTQLGTNLNTSTGFAKIRAISGGGDTNNQLMIIDGTNGYSYNIGTNIATFPIADVDFPQTCTDLETQDDYVIVDANNSLSFFISNLADSTTYNALDFASKIAKPDKLVAIKSHQEKLFLFGNKTTEVWWNSGNASFPFEKLVDTFIHTGCAAKQSIAVANETIYFLSVDETGGYKIIQMVGYTPQPVGTPAIDSLINNLTSITDAIGYCYQRDGHSFYDLTFPTDNVTITYDISTGIFISRRSYLSSTYGRFLGANHVFAFNKSLIGDYNTGKVYTQSMNVYTENGVPIQRQLVSPPLYNAGLRIFVSRLKIEVENNIGASKTFDLEASNDGGRSWDFIQTFTVPTTPATELYTSSLGSAYNWMFRITTTMDAKFCILGFQAELTFGDN